MRVYQFPPPRRGSRRGSRQQGSAGTGLNDARTILTVPILCQRTRQVPAAMRCAASAHGSPIFLNAAP